MSFIVVHDEAGRILAMGEVASRGVSEGEIRPKDAAVSGTSVGVVVQPGQHLLHVENLDECHSDKLEDIVGDYRADAAHKSLVRHTVR